MKSIARRLLVMVAAVAVALGSAVAARADYPSPAPTSPEGRRVVDIVDGWSAMFPGSIDAWELDGLAAHVAYAENSVLTWPSMQQDLRAKMRYVGATRVDFTAVQIPYTDVEAAVTQLKQTYAAQLGTGAVVSIHPTPGLTERSITVAGESEGLALVQTQTGVTYNGIRMVYQVGPQPAPAGLDIYTTPGMHLANGREWRTSCEPYSRTERCRTEIKATTIALVDGTYVQTTDWAFNNLTYVASPRGLWRGNPLGNTDSWTATDNRQWRTECDTALTGRNACRSFVMTTFIALENGRFVQKNDWQFNNMVRFS